MKKFLVLLKKEIKELLTPQLILPLVAMVVIFSFIGQALSQETEKISQPQELWLVSSGYQINYQLKDQLKQAGFELKVFDNVKKDVVLSQAKESGVDSVIFLPKNFSAIENQKQQKIEIYRRISGFGVVATMQGSKIGQAVQVMNNYYANKWFEKTGSQLSLAEVNKPIMSEDVVMVGEKSAKGAYEAVIGFISKQTTFVPIILFIVIVIAAQMVATAVATEKENKTFEILLSSPVSRKSIVLAKLVGAAIVAFLFAAFYMVGFGYYMQGLMGGQSFFSNTTAGSQVFEELGIVLSSVDYIMLGLSLFMGILVALAIAIILGSMVENVKGIQAVITPLMIMVLVPYLLTILLDINTINPVIKYIIYLIPFSHPFMAGNFLILNNYTAVVAGIVYQFVIFVIFVYVAARLFSSGKILNLKFNLKK